jgi:hypothetical protein
MKPILALGLSLFFPIVPWIAFSPWWALEHLQKTVFGWMVFSGLVLDLWWGKSLGETSVVLIAMVTALYFLKKFWPADGRFFAPTALVASLIFFEIYLFII